MLKDLTFTEFKVGEEDAVFGYNQYKPLSRGRDLLIQMIIKRIYTLQGSNAYDQNVGTNFLNLIGTVDMQKIDQVRDTIPVMLQNLADQIKSEQADFEDSGGHLPDNQKLKDLKLKTVEFDSILGGWVIVVDVETEDNQFTLRVT